MQSKEIENLTLTLKQHRLQILYSPRGNVGRNIVCVSSKEVNIPVQLFNGSMCKEIVATKFPYESHSGPNSTRCTIIAAKNLHKNTSMRMRLEFYT